MKVIESDISTVTIFSDRALILRTSSNILEKGNHLLVFENIPSRIEESSIQVNGFGNATILDVSTKSVEYLEVTKEEIQNLQNKSIEINDKLNEISDNLEEIENEREFVKNIANKLTQEDSKNQDNTLALLEPEKWESMIKFYRKKQETLNRENRKFKNDTLRLNDELKMTDNELNTLNQNQYKTGYQVVVKIEMIDEGELNLELSYIVHGAKWKPSYDIRVDSENKVVKLTYKAIITQNTTEEWKNTKVILSTAQPQISTEQKQLSPIYIDLKSVQTGLDKLSDKELKELHKKNLMEGQLSSKGGAGLGGINEERRKRKEINKSIAKVESNKTSVTFNIEGNYFIKNNNQSHEATILIKEFQTKLYYSTTPKLEEYAYLKAEILNNTEYPMLQGVANIFLDNSFIANSSINLVAAGEKFIISLGVDQNIKVEYVFINKFHKNEGIVNKKNKIFLQYNIIITNNKQETETIIIQDQLPISKHNDIVIELIEPSLKEAKLNFKKKEHEVLKWTLDIKPEEKIQIPIKYSIEYPKNDEILYRK